MMYANIVVVFALLAIAAKAKIDYLSTIKSGKPVELKTLENKMET